ncbi:MAG: tail fiber domain-containing protein, partial [Candidatus Pacebacteria bacterium]|nr:tail fiber domain-containing protein [Candidatus Paceibacterota bacterium]
CTDIRRYRGIRNTAIGALSGLQYQYGGDGDNCTYLGYGAGSGHYNVDNRVYLGNGDVDTIYAAVNSITSLSDERDKTDITPLEVGLDFIKELVPVSFKWDKREEYTVREVQEVKELNRLKEDGNHEYTDVVREEEVITSDGMVTHKDGGDGTHVYDSPSKEHPHGGTKIGVIAQAVDTAIDKYPIFKDAGLLDKGDENMLQVAPGGLIYPAIKAIQELSTQVETLTAKVAALETA